MDFNDYFYVPKKDKKIERLPDGIFKVTTIVPEPKFYTYNDMMEEFGKTVFGSGFIRVVFLLGSRNSPPTKEEFIPKNSEILTQIEKKIGNYSNSLYSFPFNEEDGVRFVTRWSGKRFLDLDDFDVKLAHNYYEIKYKESSNTYSSYAFSNYNFLSNIHEFLGKNITFTPYESPVKDVFFQ